MLVESLFDRHGHYIFASGLERSAGHGQSSGRKMFLEGFPGPANVQPILLHREPTYPLDHLMQWFQYLKHPRDVAVREIML